MQRLLKFIPTILILVALAAWSAEAARAGVFNPETFTLKNGMQVVVVPNHRVPVVTHMVWYKAGSADAEQGRTGTAHLLEHLMFKGTETRAPGEFSTVVARNGGRENAFTSTDYTAYFQTVAVDRLEMMMEMEADRMTNLVFTEEEMNTEREVVLEERRSRTDNQPSGILSEHINATLFMNYPYRNPVIGWEHDIRNLDLKSLMDFYRRWYAPNNAVLVVAGDITADRLRPLAEKYYGRIPKGPPVVRSRAQEPPQKAARRVTLTDKRVRQPSWRRTYIAPGVTYGDRGHVYPLDVLADILGSGSTSRLYRSLVIERKLAVSAGAYYSGDNRGPGRFGFYASPRPGVAMGDLEAAVNAEIERVLKEGVGADEVARAKERMLAEAVYARDSLSTGARVLGSALAVGLTVEEVETWPEHIERVTVERIKAAAAAVLKNNSSVTGLLLPEATE